MPATVQRNYAALFRVYKGNHGGPQPRLHDCQPRRTLDVILMMDSLNRAAAPP